MCKKKRLLLMMSWRVLGTLQVCAALYFMLTIRRFTQGLLNLKLTTVTNPKSQTSCKLKSTGLSKK